MGGLRYETGRDMPPGVQELTGRGSRREEREAREEKEQHPCAFCQRWGECNGVDETCPWLN